MDEPLLVDGPPLNPRAVSGDNQGPSLLALIDEAILDADDRALAHIFEILANRVCQEDPASQADREEIVALAQLWQFGGKHKGRDIQPVVSIDDDVRMTKAETLVGRINGRLKVEDGAFRRAKDNFVHKGKAVDTLFRARRGPLETAKTFLEKLLLDRAKVIRQQQAAAAAEAQAKADAADAERRRLEAEAAHNANAGTEQLQQATQVAVAARQQATAIATAPLRPATGGARTVLRGETTLEVVDIKLVPVEYLQVREGDALMALKAGKTIPGLRLVITEKAHVRK